MALLYNQNIYLCEGTHRFILVHISRRTHFYSYSSYTIMNLYIYLDGGTYPHTHIYLKLILVSISRKSYRTYAYTEVLIHVQVLISISDLPYEFTELMLIQRYLYTYRYLYLSQISRRSLQNLCLYRVTLRYYKADTYTIRLILILRRLHLFGGTRRYYRDITERILVLWNLFLYGSTRQYYLFQCPKRRTLVLISNLSYTHTGVPVGTIEFILIRSLYGDTRRYYRD